MAKKITAETRQARRNCELSHLVTIGMEAYDSPSLQVDCSKLTAPKGADLAELQKEGQALERAAAQLKKIDPRRAY